METQTPSRNITGSFWARYLRLEAERIQIVDGCLDLDQAIDRYDQIWAEQSQMRAEMGEIAWRELQDWM